MQWTLLVVLNVLFSLPVLCNTNKNVHLVGLKLSHPQLDRLI